LPILNNSTDKSGDVCPSGRRRRPRRTSRFLLTIPALLAAGIVLASFDGRGQPAHPIGVEVIIVKSMEDAQRVYDRLRAGADFAQLASEQSIDINTASDGGYLGDVDPQTLIAGLRDAIRDLKPGQFSNVVKVPMGYAILKLLKGQQNSSPPSAPQNAVSSTGGMASVISGGDWRTTYDNSGYTPFLAEMRRSIQGNPSFGEDLQEACRMRHQAPLDAIESLKEVLASHESTAAPHEVASARYLLGLLEASQGQIDEAIEQWEEVYRISRHDSAAVGQGMEEVLGSAYLHRTQLADRNSHVSINEDWLIPSHPGGPLQRPEDTQKAISYFAAALRSDPANIELKWLLNVAYMTAGTWPSAVPEEVLIPPSVLASKEDIGKFLDVAPAAGVAVIGESGSVIADDFDNDGLIDLVLSSLEDCEPLRFFHNNGDGTFSDRSAQAGLTDQTGGLNIIQADYNNDGCMDILVLRGGWEYPRRRSLLRNNCDGTFTDVTVQSGLLKPLRSSQAAVWTDIDNDGNLDLFIANENAPSQLFLNKGDGTFIDIAREAGVDRIAFSKSIVAADYDNDGYPDFYVSNQGSQGFLYHNNGDRTFTEVSGTAGVRSPRASFGALFLDYDNDGLPDLFITSYFTSVEESIRSYLGLPIKAGTLKLYKNKGDGTFRDVTAEVGLDRIFMPMGCNFGDIDNDGFPDIYMGMGTPPFSAILPNVLLHNKEGKRFIDISASSGTGAIAKGHGIAFADLGNNGNQDIFANMGGAEFGDQFTTRLFRNPGNHKNNWITLKLVGEKSNRAGIGARITVTVDDPDRGHRKIFRTVGSGGSFGASPLEQHIGIGRSARIESLEVWWPASKTRQVLTDLSPNQYLEIKEFAKSTRKLTRPSFEVGNISRNAPPAAPMPK
jgi:tetratricopeptide (TPR) repeat protein